MQLEIQARSCALQLLPSIRRRNYYITDVVVAASSAAAFNAATTTSNQPTFRSGTDARSAGRISPPTLPEIGCCFVIVRLFMISKLPGTTLRLGIVDCLIAAARGGQQRRCASAGSTARSMPVTVR